jgi:hypothetical protein
MLWQLATRMNMTSPNPLLKTLILATVLSGLPGPCLVGAAPAQGAADPYPRLPKPGAKVPLDADTYFIYGFTSQPKLGTVVMKVEIFRRDGQRDTAYTVKGDVDMPSMRGAHSTGPKPFALSKKGAYLLPAPLVMPGDWELRFTFEKNGKTVLQGAYLFEL